MKQSTTFDIQQADCLDGMAAMPDKSVHVGVTSPPYNIGIKYNRYDDTQRRTDYLAWTRRWVLQLKRVLRDDGSFFLNVGGSPSNPMLPHEIILNIRDIFVLQNTIHWIKSITTEGTDGRPVSVGHFKPVNSTRYITDCHEYVFHQSLWVETPCFSTA